MKGTKWMAFARADRGHEIVKPYCPVVVIEGQDGSTGTATANASLNHGLNLDGVEGQNKDLTHPWTPAPRSAHPIRCTVMWP